MRKFRQTHGTGKAYLVCALALVAMTGLFTISSCRKEALTQAHVNELGAGPMQVESFQYIPTHRTRINFNVMDAKGNVMTLAAYKKSVAKGGQPLDCGSGSGLDMMELYSLGFTFENKCFANTPSQFSMGMTYELTVPADMEPIRTAPASKANISVAPYGWLSTPSGTGGRNIGFSAMTLVSSYSINGVNMKTWRFTTFGSQINMNDYCMNNTIYSKFQVATTCSNFTIVSNNDIIGGTIPDDFNVSQLQVPGVVLNGAMNGSIHQIGVYWQVPICQLPVCSEKGYYQWAQTVKFRYRKQPTLSWTTPPANESPRTNLNFFAINPLPAGTYTFQYAADLNGTWSDWQTQTVVVQ